MASLLEHLAKPSAYKDRYFKGTDEEWTDRMQMTCTLYVGNLSFYTTEEQIYALFSMVGELKRVIMGLDKFKRTPCGFCFVEYYRREDAEAALKYISKSRLDDRIIRCDFDPGFEDGRQFGRGKSGGQVRDEYRQDYDTGRGGWGVRMRGRVYDEDEVLPGGGQMYSGRGEDVGMSKHARDETDDFGGQNPRFRNKRRQDDQSDDDQ